MKLWPGIVLLMIAVGGCAPPKGNGIADEDASFKIPAIKSAVNAKDRHDLGQMVKDLDDEDPAVRFYASEGLRRLTGENFDYHYYDDIVARQPAIDRWKQWLESQKK